LLAVASSNSGKVTEYSLLLSPLKCRIFGISREELERAGFKGIREPEEDGDSFFENARIKARYWADVLGSPALADDSGLEVAALGGEPGVRSARWGDWDPGAVSGREQSEYLIWRMEGMEDRAAAFVTSIVVARPFRREVLHYRGTLRGEVAREPKGSRGFGYDQAFLVPGLGLTLAELSAEEKNAVSHRGRAAGAMAGDWERVSGFLAGSAPPPGAWEPVGKPTARGESLTKFGISPINSKL
jgi:XTP/dITP diphosphohydrolase